MSRHFDIVTSLDSSERSIPYRATTEDLADTLIVDSPSVMPNQAPSEVYPQPSRIAAESAPRKPERRFSKQYRLSKSEVIREEEFKLVQRVFLANGEKSPRVVLFCGVESGNGCSRICSRVGEILAARSAETVCIVDANLRSPSLHTLFGLHNGKGFTDAMRGPARLRDYAIPLNGSLWIITSGRLPHNKQSWMNSEESRSRITELRSSFDYVLIDGAPLKPYTDATLLSPLTDGVVLVVEANNTQREVVKKAKEEIESNNCKILGVVLNRRTFPVPERIYRYL